MKYDVNIAADVKMCSLNTNIFVLDIYRNFYFSSVELKHFNFIFGSLYIYMCMLLEVNTFFQNTHSQKNIHNSGKFEETIIEL